MEPSAMEHAEAEQTTIQEAATRQNVKRKINPNLLLVAVAAILICLTVLILSFPQKEAEPTMDITTTLEKIIKTSDLATSVFQYQGIVEVPNQKKPKKIDYYICYSASVYAGIDFAKVTFSENKSSKVITATLPEVRIIDTDVDPESLDFMFQNDKADNISVTTVALTACENDIRQECTNGSALLDVARMNAENAVRALAEPIIESTHKGYTLVIQAADATDSAESEEGSVENEN